MLVVLLTLPQRNGLLSKRGDCQHASRRKQNFNTCRSSPGELLNQFQAWEPQYYESEDWLDLRFEFVSAVDWIKRLVGVAIPYFLLFFFASRS